jgi:glycosyltransferase involved in cell wall biosynthesis
MRIAVWDNLPSGGGKRALHEQVKRLAARGHAIESWCPDTAETMYLPLAEFGPQHVLPLGRGRYAGRSRIWAIQAWLNLRDTRRELAALERHARECAEAIDRSGADVVLVGGSQVMPVPAIGRYLRRPAVLYLQEPMRSLHEARPVLPWLGTPNGANARRKRPWTELGNWWDLRRLQCWGKEEARNANAFPTILVNSHFSREAILRTYGREAYVCYLGVDTEWFAPGANAAKQPYAVALGEFTFAKGVDRVLHAMASVDAAAKPALEWVCNREDPACAEFADTFCRANGITLRRHVAIPDPLVREILQRAAVMLYMPRLEPFGLAPLEANACGTVAVAGAEGGVREAVADGESGVLVPANSPAEAAEAVMRFVSNLALAAEAGQRAREHVVKRWGWEASVMRLEAYLIHAARGS